MSVEVQLPPTAPVMVLPGCNFFPHAPLPLYIFEPRYRAMLAFCLESECMFCIGTLLDPGHSGLPHDREAGIYLHGTIGLVRACVTHPDGTSNLVLEGLRRVLYLGWVRETPFRIAAIQPLVSILPEDEGKTEAAVKKLTSLAMALMERCGDDHGILQPMLEEQDLEPERLVDLAANYLLPDVHQRHALLGMENVFSRMTFVIDQLKGQLDSMGPSKPGSK